MIQLKIDEYTGDAVGSTDCILMLFSFTCVYYECVACHTEQRGYAFETWPLEVVFLSRPNKYQLFKLKK